MMTGPGGTEASASAPGARAAQGFGFEQLFYKSRETGQIGRFSEAERYAIVDQREIGSRYDWVIVRLRIFGFRVTLHPLGSGSPELAVTLGESSYLVLSREFITDCEHPASGVAGDYGLGYAFIKSPIPASILAYGPGEFDAAFQTIGFRVLETGEIRACLSFVANRPVQVTRVFVDPLRLSVGVANLASFGLFSTMFPSVLRPGTTTVVPNFNPVLGVISALNLVTGGQAARNFCLSKEELERRFLVQHFMQHYQTIAGSLMTWRQFRNWLDTASLPDWVVNGVSL